MYVSGISSKDKHRRAMDNGTVGKIHEEFLDLMKLYEEIFSSFIGPGRAEYSTLPVVISRSRRCSVAHGSTP